MARRGTFSKEKNPNYKHGKSYNNKCIGCNKKISFGAKRCKSCARKFEYKDKSSHPFYGKYHTKESKEKISFKSFGDKSYQYIDGRCLKKYYCIDCGIEVSDYRCKRCKSCGAVERMKIPSNHPSYIDGRSFIKYPKKFNRKLKEKILQRDNYQCQNEDCNIFQAEHLIVYDRNLHVHHIDYDKMNCNEDNLITLCFQCNLRANYGRVYWQEYYLKQVRSKYGIKIKT